MVMMGLQLTDTLPFTDVYLHAMVRDKDGRKMSKSLGNVIDPLEVIDGCPLETLVEKLRGGNLKLSEVERAVKAHSEDFPEGIPKCGTDALRVGLLAYTVQGRDINLDIKRVVGYRMFCNKLWNAVRFMLGVFKETDFSDDDGAATTTTADALKAKFHKLAFRDRFILSRLAKTLDLMDAHLTNYAFGDAVRCLYEFFLNDLCDVYLEFVKPVVYGGGENDDDDQEAEGATTKKGSSSSREAVTLAKMTLWLCLDAGLRALHPLCPFVTEELWQRLPRSKKVQANLESIMVADYPTTSNIPVLLEAKSDDVEAQTAVVLACATAARSLRAQYDLRPKVAAKFFVKIKDSKTADRFQAQQQDFVTLANAETLTVLREDDPDPDGCAITIVDEALTVLVDLKGLVDVDAEITKLTKQIADLQPLIAKLRAKQADPTYLAKAPEKLRNADADKLANYAERRDTAQAAIAMWQNTRSQP
mmetsp:Transcript_6071/g.19795  ORF Transcript_6071/g.19795 Transcript_6071/m.19795 type:complete len:475 (-) Transcript_6071:294-1718(-)